MSTGFPLGDFAYAHRGLWSPNGPPENSLAAFEAAAKAGCGAELDVRLSADGAVVVFHDPVLDRMTEASGLVPMTASAELTALTLAGSRERIPTLADVLDMWPSDLPLLIELKTDGAPAPLAEAVMRILADFRGLAAVMSFDTEAALGCALAGHVAGLLVEPSSMAGEAAFREKLARADGSDFTFAAIHKSDIAEDRRAVATRNPVAVWTIDREEDLNAVSAHVDAIIFENLDPALARPGPAF